MSMIWNTENCENENYGGENYGVTVYYNDLLGKQTSEWGRDEVTFSYVGVGGLSFFIHLGTMDADFWEKISAEISGKNG